MGPRLDRRSRVPVACCSSSGAAFGRPAPFPARIGPLRVAIFQFAPAPGQISSNAERIAEASGQADADLLVTPELSLSGYDLGDAALGHALNVEVGQSIAGPAALARFRGTVLVGLPEQGDDANPYNSLVALEAGRVLFRHRKIYLPTYGMFDEARFWGRGRTVRGWRHGDWSIGCLICEDFWHPGLVWALAVRGLHLLVVAAAAPGRGLSAEPGNVTPFASWESWVRMARVTAEVYGVYVIVANRVGVEGGLTFAGGSVVVAPDGTPVAHAGPDEALVRCDLSMDAIRRARRTAAHARDEDDAIVIDAIRDSLA